MLIQTVRFASCHIVTRCFSNELWFGTEAEVSVYSLHVGSDPQTASTIESKQRLNILILTKHLCFEDPGITANREEETSSTTSSTTTTQNKTASKNNKTPVPEAEKVEKTTSKRQRRQRNTTEKQEEEKKAVKVRGYFLCTYSYHTSAQCADP